MDLVGAGRERSLAGGEGGWNLAEGGRGDIVPCDIVPTC